MSARVLVVTVDPASGRALVRGVHAERACRAISANKPRYSGSGRGWVIAWPGEVLDLEGYCQAERLIFVRRDR